MNVIDWTQVAQLDRGKKQYSQRTIGENFAYLIKVFTVFLKTEETGQDEDRNK